MASLVNYEFKNTSEFLSIFNLDNNSRYEGVTHLQDSKIGFSVLRAYPTDIRYKPATTKSGRPDTFALIYMSYGSSEKTSDERNPQHIPITVRIVKYSKYLSQHFDYNFEDENCPTEESIRRSKVTPQPIGLDYIDDFFFDHRKKKFFDQSKRQYKGIELLDKVFDDHCNTIHPVKGFKLRAKLKTQFGLINIFNVLIEKIPWILNRIFGRTLEEENNRSAFLHGYKREHFKKLSTESIDISGYKASKSVIILFCVLVAVIYVIKYKFGLRSEYLESIASSTLLAPIHLIILLWFLDVVLPNGIFLLLNRLIKGRIILMQRKFKYP